MSDSTAKIDNRLRSLTHRLCSRVDALPADLPAERLIREELMRLLPAGPGLEHLGRGEQESLRVELERFCFVNDWDEILRNSGITHPYRFRQGFPQQPPAPFPDSPLVDFPRSWSLLGREIGFPIGVPASVLTSTSKWIEYFAKHGFNVFTYKTVRSARTAPHEFPNWIFLEGSVQPLPVEQIDETHDPIQVQGSRDTYLQHLRRFSTANSFGVPSEDPAIWREDVERALGLLGDDKLLILSVMGSAEPGESVAALRDDFIRVTEEALRTGAPAIELNLSCPNTADASARDGIAPPLCMDVNATVEVIAAAAEVVGGRIPLVAKLSYLPFHQLEPLIGAISPYIAAISGINTLQVQVQVEEEGGAPTFPGRHTAGMSGIAIRDLGLDFVKSLNRMRIENEALDFEIIGMGGVMTTEDVDALLVAGASAVQTATAAAVNPYLAREVSQSRSERRPSDESKLAELRSLLYAPDGSFRGARDVAARLHLAEDEVERQLNPAGEVDLPRRFFELVALTERPTDARSHSEESGPWGPPPSSEMVVAVEFLDEELRRSELGGLVSNSLPLEEIARLTNLEPQEVESSVRQGSLISFEHEGEQRLPVWQLKDDGGELLPGLEMLNHAFGNDAIAVSQWVLAPNPQLGGQTPRDLLRQGEADRVELALTKLGAAAF
jgi:dihydroorotate dehydrogenase